LAVEYPPSSRAASKAALNSSRFVLMCSSARSKSALQIAKESETGSINPSSSRPAFVGTPARNATSPSPLVSITTLAEKRIGPSFAITITPSIESPSFVTATTGASVR